MLKFYKLILFFFSFVNIIKIKFKKIKCANYFIINNNTAIFDQRSSNFFDLKTCEHSLNLVRIQNLDYKIFFNIFKIPNFFCFSIIKNFSLNKLDKFLFMYLMKNIFIFLKIKRLLLIDDTREMKFFSTLSKRLNLHSLIYMHGKFSKRSKIHQNTKFNTYLVWSNFFKRQLLKSNNFYKTNNVIVIGNPNFKKKYSLKKKKISIKKCLILDEDYINYDDIKAYLFSIVKINTIQFFFKKKISRNIPKNIELFCKKNKIKIIHNSDNLEKTIRKYKIDSIIASTSTGLLEGIYYGVVPIKFFSKNMIKESEFKIFLEKDMIYAAKNPKVMRYLLKKKFHYQSLIKSKKVLWEGASFKSAIVKNRIKKFVMNKK